MDIRLAVIGMGHLGKIHARLSAQLEGVQLVALADPSPLVQRQTIETSDVPIVSDFRKLIGQLDAAIVATPTRNHFEIAESLLLNGIHTLIEKPMTECPYQARQLIDLSDRQGCVLAVGHVEQFNPAFVSALKLVGQPKFIQATRCGPYTYRSTDIGVVHDLMIHDIDLINTAFPGEMFASQACGFSVFGSLEDMAQARLQFDCGGIANLTASRCSFNCERSMQIFGTLGFASIDFTQHLVKAIQYPNWLRSRQFDFAAATAEQQDFIKQRLFTDLLPIQEFVPPRSNAILEEQRQWIAAIRNQGSLLHSPQQACEAVRIADQIVQQILLHSWNGNHQSSGPMAIFPSPDYLHASVALPAPLAKPPRILAA